MKKQSTSILLSLSLLLSLTGCQTKIFTPDTDRITCIHIIDRNGFSETFKNPDRIKQYSRVNFESPQPYQKVLRIFGKDQYGRTLSKITSYHDNGQIKQSLDVINNRAGGTYREWYPTGVLKIQANVIGGEADLTAPAEKTWLFDGLNQVWSEDGTILATINYSKGLLEGDSVYYHPNGKIWKIAPFVKNNMHGTLKIYLENEELLSITEYVDGYRQGESLRYWSDCKPAYVENYDKDLLSSAQYYDINGKLISEITNGNGYKVLFGKSGISEMHEYRHGVPEGEVLLYNPNGTLFSVYHVKESLKHGEEIEYYDPIFTGKELMPKISLNWHQGKIQGFVRTWYVTGVQESQREMSNNKKNGISTAWYFNGGLMLIEEYDLNKLVKGQYYKLGERTPVSTISNGTGTATLYDSVGNFLRKVPYLNGTPED